MQDVTEHRRALRAAGRAARAAITGTARTEATAAVVARLLALPEVAAAELVLLTAAVGTELDLAAARSALLERGTAVALPIVDGDHLHAVPTTATTAFRTGWRGVSEPVGELATRPPDVVVVPALALDRSGGRLGYGGGHFDRYLSGPASGATTIGAVFDAQVVSRIPLLPHDVRLDVVVTERGVWRGDHTSG